MNAVTRRGHRAHLTDDERKAIDLTAELGNTLARVVGDGPTRHHDLAELYAHVHAIQHAVMSQVAARVYPEWIRELGKVIEPEETRCT